MSTPGELESTHHDIRILRAFLRSEEMRRDRFLREMEIVQASQGEPGQSDISRWMGEVTLQRWRDEVAAVDRCIAMINAKIEELEKRSPPAHP